LHFTPTAKHGIIDRVRILVSPDKFKGSLSAGEAAAAIVDGWRTVFPDAEFHVLPIADGGEGTAEIVCAARAGKWVELTVSDPLGRTVPARYALIEGPEGRTAVMEMSEASGLWRLNADERNLWRATTRGTGELMAHAIAESKVVRLIIGIGGSATNDGGVGMAAAIGYKFLDSAGAEIEAMPSELSRLARIVAPSTKVPPVLVACDVRNPLLGDRGATAIYGPQKGLRPADRAGLEKGLERLADVTLECLGHDFREIPGAGAAGGLGFGLLSYCGAQLQPGFDLVSDLIGLEKAVQDADLVLTGEGSLDGQTLEGKGPAGVAMLAKKHGKFVAAFAGRIAVEADAEQNLRELFNAVIPLAPGPLTFEESVARGSELLRSAAARAGGWVKIGGRF
jgi:glycerate 2-kinase